MTQSFRVERSSAVQALMPSCQWLGLGLCFMNIWLQLEQTAWVLATSSHDNQQASSNERGRGCKGSGGLGCSPVLSMQPCVWSGHLWSFPVFVGGAWIIS